MQHPAYLLPVYQQNAVLLSSIRRFTTTLGRQTNHSGSRCTVFGRRALRADSMMLAHTTSRDVDYEASPSNAILAKHNLIAGIAGRAMLTGPLKPQHRLPFRITGI